MAIQFLGMSDQMDEIVANLLLIEQMRKEEPRVLVCGGREWLDVAERDLRAAGFSVLHARSALEAITALQNPWNAIAAVAMEPTLLWLEFSDFLGQEHPGLHRAMIAGPESMADLYLAKSKGLIDGGIYGPWQPNVLFDALALPARSECLSCQRRAVKGTGPFCEECIEWSTDISEEFDDLGCGD
jgi:hypothetical protein